MPRVCFSSDPSIEHYCFSRLKTCRCWWVCGSSDVGAVSFFLIFMIRSFTASATASCSLFRSRYKFFRSLVFVLNIFKNLEFWNWMDGFVVSSSLIPRRSRGLCECVVITLSVCITSCLMEFAFSCSGFWVCAVLFSRKFVIDDSDWILNRWWRLLRRTDQTRRFFIVTGSIKGKSSKNIDRQKKPPQLHGKS